MTALRLLAAFVLLPLVLCYAVLGADAPPTLKRMVVQTADTDAVFRTGPGVTVSDLLVQGSAGANGRGVTLVNAPRANVLNVECKPSGDDALCLAGDCRGSVVVGYEQHQGDWSVWNHGLIAYTGADTGAAAQPIYGLADGYAGQFIRCWFEASQPPIRVMGGVWQFIDCDIVISPLAGIDAMDAKLNLIQCRFHTMPKGAKPPYGYMASGPCPIRVQTIVGGKQAPAVGKTRIFTAGCSLDGQPVATADLLRLFDARGYRGPGEGIRRAIVTNPIVE